MNGNFKITTLISGIFLFLFIFIIKTDTMATGFGAFGLGMAGTEKKTVVIDPGHGGNDRGACGPGGSLEKLITLELARALEAELSDAFRVILTRRGDYSVDVFSRTAVANHEGASLFLSLHTGAGHFHSTRGYRLYHIKAPSDVDIKISQKLPLPPKFNVGKERPINWDEIQKQYAATSAAFTKVIVKHLSGIQAGPGNPKMGKPIIREAPMLVLKGADMPAILVEIGFITNPVEEKQLSDPRFLKKLSISLAGAIKEFLQNQEKNEPD